MTTIHLDQRIEKLAEELAMNYEKNLENMTEGRHVDFAIDKNDVVVYLMPMIKKLCGVEVSVRLYIKKDKSIRIVFVNNYSSEYCRELPYYGDPIGFYVHYFRAKENQEEPILERIRQFLCVSLPHFIHSVQFDKLYGQFVVPGDLNFPCIDNSNVCDLLKDMDKEEKLGFTDICSVCHDHTMTQTPCGHLLCLVCWTNLPITYVNCPTRGCRRDVPLRSCPICRRALNEDNDHDYGNLHDHDDDDDDEEDVPPIVEERQQDLDVAPSSS